MNHPTFGSKKPVGLKAEIISASEETYNGAIIKLAGLFCKVIDLLLLCDREQFKTYWDGQIQPIVSLDPVQTKNVKKETKKDASKKASRKKA